MAVLAIVAGSPPAFGQDDDLNSFGELTAAYRALDAQRFEEALGHYRSALDKAQSSNYRFQAYFGMGSVLSALGRHEEATDALEKAAELQPEHGEALYMLGLEYAQTGRTDEAIATLERSIANAPDLVASHHGLSLLYAQLGWNEQAEASCRKVLSLDPDHMEAKIGLGVALYHQGAYPEAITAFENALQQEPENPRALYGLGLSHLLAGDEKAAVEQYLVLSKIDKPMAKDLYLKIMERRR